MTNRDAAAATRHAEILSEQQRDQLGAELHAEIARLQPAEMRLSSEEMDALKWHVGPGGWLQCQKAAMNGPKGAVARLGTTVLFVGVAGTAQP